MSASFRRILILCTAVLCVLSLAAAGCLFAGILSDYDSRIHHFAVGSAPAAAAAVLCAAGAVLSLAAAVLVRCRKDGAAPAASLPAVFVSALVGFLMIFSFIFDIASAADWSSRIRLGLMALSAFYFLIATQRTETLSSVGALLSLAPIAYAFLSVLDIYFDTTMGMNAPLKSYYLMMYLSMSLFFTAETRTALGRTNAVSYCLFAGLCITFCGAVGFSHILLALRGTAFILSLRDSILIAAVAVYAAVRLFSLRKLPAAEEKTAEEVQP